MKVILTNQHCDNRGDESATIGIIKQIYQNFGEDTQITMIRQTNKYQFIPDEYHINEIDMNYKPMFVVQMILWCIFKFIHIDIRKLLSQQVRTMIHYHEEADLVLSSCGGPYIGDIYINHEIIHILYVLVPELLEKTVVFSAPSMGPFHKKYPNPLRKYILKKAKAIVLRDAVSYQYVRTFLKKKQEIYLAADACFADVILDTKEINKRKNIIGFTPLEYKYPNAADKNAEVEKYKKSIIRLFDEWMEDDQTLQIEFFPQLYNKHSDLKLIKEFISRMKYPDRTIIFSDQLSGPIQQKEIGNMKMMIATRYHSAVFSCKMHVPCVCIAYEHKAFAMMESFDLTDCVIDINQMNYLLLKEKAKYVQENRERIYIKQVEKLPGVTKNAMKTIYIAKSAYEKNNTSCEGRMNENR